MNYVALTEKLIKAITTDSDMVTVKEFLSDEENKVIIQVLVSESDLPKVIGKGGKIINAIRTILKASSSLHDRKIITINVESF